MDRRTNEPTDGDARVASMEDLERRLVSWAARRRDVRTVLVVGSRARVDHPADEWSASTSPSLLPLLPVT